MSNAAAPTAALLAAARNVLAHSQDPQALSAARLVVARAEVPGPLRLATVLPWVRAAFALTTLGAVYPVAESPAIVGARCRACKALVEPTAEGLAGHECAT